MHETMEDTKIRTYEDEGKEEAAQLQSMITYVRMFLPKIRSLPRFEDCNVRRYACWLTRMVAAVPS